jgi:3-isopropylmalate/(R)-2-methylmalate dehydratase small subunit
MRAVSRVVGTAVVIDRDNVDTDQIIPSRYLKKITRTGYAEGLFAEWRKDPAFPLNDPARRGASVLIAGANFGCGSSREHAAWALDEWGIRAVIAPSFGDIFRGNCLKIGLVPIALPAAAVERLASIAGDPRATIEADVASGRVRASGFEVAFPLDEFTRYRLVEGLDDIGLTLRRTSDIASYEAERPGWRPSVTSPRRP